MSSSPPAPIPATTRGSDPGLALVIRGARGRNLDIDELRFPIGALTVVTGPSGSGRRSLVRDTLLAKLRGEHALPLDDLKGGEHIQSAVEVPARPFGNNARSMVVTRAGLWGHLRELLAATPEAKIRGRSASNFVLTRAGGRCEACEGRGTHEVDLGLLPPLSAPCPVCDGRRFNRATLGVRYRGDNVADLLDSTVSEARAKFSAHRRLAPPLTVIEEVGLGYLRLGQPLGSLSGGEAQRLRLAVAASKGAEGRLFVLEEPSTGLHPRDVQRLARLLHRLARDGGTLIAVDHDPELIRSADHLIRLGPGAGAAGGRLVYQGQP